MTRFDPAWLDVQYNNRARVPAHAEIFGRWAVASDDRREGWSRGLDVAYGRIRPNARRVPGPSAEAPVLVFIHGG